MYQDNDESKHNYRKTRLERQRRRIYHKKFGILLISLLILGIAAGGTVAFLVARTKPVVNKFIPASVNCKVTEQFDGTTKSNVNVINTGDIEAYIRVRLVTYRVNATDNHKIGGTAEIPSFDLGDKWKQYKGYYYYTLPVKPGENPDADLIGASGIKLEGKYNDADGGKQVIEVMAEAIQSKPAPAVSGSWGVTVNDDGSIAIPSGN